MVRRRPSLSASAPTINQLIPTREYRILPSAGTNCFYYRPLLLLLGQLGPVRFQYERFPPRIKENKRCAAETAPGALRVKRIGLFVLSAQVSSDPISSSFLIRINYRTPMEHSELSECSINLHIESGVVERGKKGAGVVETGARRYLIALYKTAI